MSRANRSRVVNAENTHHDVLQIETWKDICQTQMKMRHIDLHPAEMRCSRHEQLMGRTSFVSALTLENVLYTHPLMYQRALAGTDGAHGPEHTLTLDAVHALGRPYLKQGKLDTAEQMFERA